MSCTRESVTHLPHVLKNFHGPHSGRDVVYAVLTKWRIPPECTETYRSVVHRLVRGEARWAAILLDLIVELVGAGLDGHARAVEALREQHALPAQPVVRACKLQLHRWGRALLSQFILYYQEHLCSQICRVALSASSLSKCCTAGDSCSFTVPFGSAQALADRKRRIEVLRNPHLGE